jgi:hypothetical protein
VVGSPTFAESGKRYVSRTSEVSGVSREVVEADLRAELRARPPEERPVLPDHPPGQQEPHRPRRPANPPQSVVMELELVRILLYRPDFIPTAAEEVSAADFRVPEYRQIYMELLESDETPDLQTIAGHLNEVTVIALQYILEKNRPDLLEVDKPEAVLQGVIGQLRALAARREAEQLQAELQNAGTDDKDNLLRRITNLQRDGVASGSRRWKQFTSHNH